jgi:hypothetical protein
MTQAEAPGGGGDSMLPGAGGQCGGRDGQHDGTMGKRSTCPALPYSPEDFAGPALGSCSLKG